MPKILILFMMLMQPHESPLSETDSTFLRSIDPRVSRGAKKAYNSSVLIHSLYSGGENGIGSGNYFKIKDHRFIITALHVVEGAEEVRILERSGDFVYAKIAMIDKERDLAVLKISERLRYTEPVKYSVDETTLIGQKIHHCGHPNQTFFNLAEGIITNREGEFYYTNASSWPGSSGSVVFSEGGKVIGVISSVEVGMPYGLPQLVPYLARMGRLKYLTSKQIVEALMSSEN